jgi:hypothetical protein
MDNKDKNNNNNVNNNNVNNNGNNDIINNNVNNNGNNDIINNAILRVETLEKEYDLFLKQYEEAYKNYINLLNTSSNPCEKYKLESKRVSQECYNKIWSDQKCTTEAPVMGKWKNKKTYDELVNDSYNWATLTDEDHRKGCYGDTTEYTTNLEPTYSLGKEFAMMPGRTWWGTHGIKEGAADTKEECISMCASDSSCTGATFNPVKKYCWTRGGDGTLSTGLPDDNALIPKLKGVVLILNRLNDKLMTINNELRTETKKITPQIKAEKEANEKKLQKFDEYYYELNDDKSAMAKLLNEYNSVDADLTSQSLFVNQQNLSFRIWALASFILCLAIFKMSGGSSGTPSIDTFINMIFVISIMILIFSINKPTGFATLGLALILFLIYKLKSGSPSSSSS